METECRVNIYITTSIRGPAKRNGGYGYVIEFIKKMVVQLPGVGLDMKQKPQRIDWCYLH